MKKLNPADFIPMDIFVEREPIKIDLVYADAKHPRNIFGEAIYSQNARLWAHKDLAAITLLAASKLHKSHEWTMDIKDCLRTIDAQTAMQKTDVVQAHPEWMIDGPDRLLAPPGAGGHPRGMAIDVHPIDKNDTLVDMGTPFDHMEESSARNYTGFSKGILENRKILEDAFMNSATSLGFEFLPLPSEWWDFRFPSEYSDQYAHLSDADLPPQMQMTNKIDNKIPDFDDDHFEKLADSIIALIERTDGNI